MQKYDYNAINNSSEGEGDAYDCIYRREVKMTTKVNIERKILTLFILVVLGMLFFTKSSSTRKRMFTFHMDTSYLHGSGKYNKGYPADKGNNNPYATVDLNWFDVTSGSPTISMWAETAGQ